MSVYTAIDLELPGVRLLRPTVYEDVRGRSVNTYHEEEFRALGITASFVQDYSSFSRKGVIRGLHYQRAPHSQEKLIRCATGRVLDVVADCDLISATFGRHISVELDVAKGEILFVPGRYAHGFCVLSDEGALVEYKMSAFFNLGASAGVCYDDPALGIEWPVADPILSSQDAAWPKLSIHE